MSSLSRITSGQKETLKNFRESLLDDGIISVEGDTLGTQYDWVLLRFLRARQYNIPKAKVMIKKCIEWRKTVRDVGIDELYRQMDPYDYPEREEVFKYWPIWYHKTDKRGRPINIQSFGGIDIEGLSNVLPPEKHWETIVVTAESLVREVLPASSYQAGHLIDEVFIIIDLKGFGIGKFWQMRTLVRDCFQITQDYYPETMGQVCIINAPFGFSRIWNFVKPWLSRETQNKIDILGSDYEQTLLEIVDAENLPTSFGGSCTCEDEGGCITANSGPWMKDRKERRERWLRGEVPRPGLSLEDGEKQLDSDRRTTSSTSRDVPISAGGGSLRGSANEY